MEHPHLDSGTGTTPMPRTRRWPVHSVGHTRGSLVGLGLAVALMAGGKCAAEPVLPRNMQQDNWGLTIRPREMATGVHTAKAGEFSLDSFPDFKLYVPQQCVGSRRCPLVVTPEPYYMTVGPWNVALADKYGMIVFMDYTLASPSPRRMPQADSALQQVLRTFAIDPEKIALIGSRNIVFYWGRPSADVFSRIASIDPTGSQSGMPADLPENANTKIEYFLVGGLEDEFSAIGLALAAEELRDQGHRVKQVLSLKPHDHRIEDFESAGRWLQESWASPRPTVPPGRGPVADSMPVLTTEALAKMMAFWSRLAQQPDSIANLNQPEQIPSGRKPYVKEIPLSVGAGPLSVLMTDMAALAAAYPAVAADLKAAGLTAQEHDAYRAALISARLVWRLNDEDSRRLVRHFPRAASVEASSVLGKNVAFLEAHPTEVEELVGLRLWATP